MVKDSKTMLFVGLGAGGVVLSCCCISIGVGTHFFFLRSPPEKTMSGKWGVNSSRVDIAVTASTPEKTMIGKWTVDVDEFKKSKDFQDKIKDVPEAQKDAMLKMVVELLASLTVEIKSDNTISMSEPMSKTTQTGKWKHLSTKDKIATIEMSYDKAQPDGNKTETGQIRVLDNDHIVLIGDAGKPDMPMKRVK
jgi:hypothetical protein